MFHSKAWGSRAAVGSAIALVAAACGGDSKDDSDSQGSEGATAAGLRAVEASAANLTAVAWGRLVDVRDWDAAEGTGGPVLSSVVVGPDVATDDVDYRLVRDAVTGRDELTVLHPAGTAAFDRALARAERAVVPIDARSALDPRLDGSRPVARDGALVLSFADALDPRTVDRGAVQLAVRGAGSSGPAAAVESLRVLPDPNHGRPVDVDGDGAREWAPSRILVDLAVDELEATFADTPVEPGAGLPGDVVATVALGVPGAAASGAAARRPVPVVLAAFRTRAGPEGVMGGSGPPLVIGDQSVSITQVSTLPGGDFQLDLTFADAGCALAAEPRDVLILPAGVLQVVSGGPPSGASVQAVARLREGDPAGVVPGPAVFRSPWLLAAGDPPECFVRTVPPAHVALGIQPDSVFVVRFSEAMDPTSLRAMESVGLRRTGAASPVEEPVVGEVALAASLRVLTFEPVLPLAHVAGSSETYLFDLLGGIRGVRDLSGIPMQQDLPGVPFQVNPNAPAADTGGVALRFASADEDGNGAPEVRGQFLHDRPSTRLLPRPVTRFSAAADGDTLTTNAMTPFAPGATAPLNPLGAHLQTAWRYVDLGLSLEDESTMNVDVEGLAWAPLGGQVVADSFGQFEMALGHASRTPDEVLNSALLPLFPNSGMRTTYVENEADGLRVVHPRERGYVIDPADTFVSAGGTTMIPWPLNQGVPAGQFEHFTWRDTTVQAVGGAQGGGVDPLILFQLQGIPPQSPVYGPGEVPTVGLPLLMDFKTFPDDQALGLNALTLRLALNTSPRPEFRAFSSGGVDANGGTALVDPDLDTTAQGGFGPSGTPTPPRDNGFYFGQADFVVRVSVLHTIWFDTQSTSTQFAQPVAVENGARSAAPGTDLEVALRGADSLGSLAALADATLVDYYGESEGTPTLFFQDDPTWKADASDLNGARYVQARVTMVSNAATGATTSLDALGLAFAR